MILRDFTSKAQPLAADYVYIASAADSFAERRCTVAALLTSQTLTNCTLDNPTMTTPTLGEATALAINGVTIAASGSSASGFAALTIPYGDNVTITGVMNLVGVSGSGLKTYTLPTTSATIGRTDAAQTFTGTQTFSGTIAAAAITASSVSSTGLIKSSSSSAGIGYATGAGSAVTQITSSATGVTINNVCGQITTVALTTAAAAEEVFTVTNSRVASTDVVDVGTTYDGAGTPQVTVKAIGSGTFKIVITNIHASDALNAVLVVNFAIIKAVTS